MADGRRHSVDVPISKTLIALRRVKSLRDPSTNAMSKLSTLVENVKWETDSRNAISLQFIHGGKKDGSTLLNSTDEKADQDDDFELHCGRRITDSNRKLVAGLDYYGLSQEHGLTTKRYHNVDEEELDNVDSLNDSLSIHSNTFQVDEELDGVDSSNRGCGIGYCWSRTPKFRELSASLNVEDLPLLAGDLGEPTKLTGQWKHRVNQLNPKAETPRSLGLKFRPSFFNELVGQNVVVTSLLGAISKGRISSVYIFHGPRGTGKTSASRIFAAALNCLTLSERKPCGSCRECVSLYTGKSMDVEEVDSVNINRTDRVRSLIRSALSVPPVSSRFKIFVVDECQLLCGESWAKIVNCLDKLPQHVVFVMITPDLDNLPRSLVSRSQRYHFPKINDVDIANKLEKICVVEGFEFDRVGLDFVAAKSNGSVRDAEMMLEQLSLVGKRITLTSVYELIGVVSDDELLELLDLALSCDPSNTVIRARELMKSRIEPMQLITQLANLIMDVLVGKCQEGSQARRNFSNRYNSEEELQRLGHALRILSDTEKHLRVSKNQTTWLTAALLQLSSVDSSSIWYTKHSTNAARDKDVDDFRGASSERKSLDADAIETRKVEDHEECEATLESMWMKVTESCRSHSFKNFLRKRGLLSSLHVSQGLVVAELEFNHKDNVSRAEKSWKSIANAFQTTLGCNVEIRINLALSSSSSAPNLNKIKNPFFSLFGCARRMKKKLQSTKKRKSDADYSDYASEKPIMKGRPSLTCSCNCGSEVGGQFARTELTNALRNSQGNVLTISSRRSFQDDATSKPPGNNGGGPVKEEEEVTNGQYNNVLSIQKTTVNQSHCFPLLKELRLSNASRRTVSDEEENNKLALSILKENTL